MAKDTTIPDAPIADVSPPKRGRKPLAERPAYAKLDLTKPIAILLHQTDGGYVTQVLTSDDPAALMRLAGTTADEMAIRLKRQVAVFSPQSSVVAPPTAAATVPLGF